MACRSSTTSSPSCRIRISAISIHIGGIQIYGGRHAHLKGNYFHDNGDSAGGLSVPRIGDHDLIEDNVWVCTCLYPWSIQAAATDELDHRHNTFAGGGGLHFHTESGIASGNLIRDNVFTTRGNGITWDPAAALGEPTTTT